MMTFESDGSFGLKLTFTLSIQRIEASSKVAENTVLSIIAKINFIESMFRG